jgi:hypothetical protein
MFALIHSQHSFVIEEFSTLMVNLPLDEPREVCTNVVDLPFSQLPSQSFDGWHMQVNINK